MTKIYYLHLDNVPFYIGKSVNITSRLYSHRQTYGKQIGCIILDEVSNDEWLFWEKFYISQFKSWGFNLTNQNNGGGGSTRASQSKIDKLSKIKSKPILQYSSEGNFIREWDSIKKCAEFIGTCAISICRNLKGKYNTSSGFQFRYKTDNYPLKIEPYKHKNSRPILQYDLNGNFIKEWYSGLQASKELKINKYAISNALRGLSKSSGGYCWIYKN